MIFVSILTMLVGLGTLGLFIVVLIKLFQNEGVGKGILGLICSLYTLVWGWQKHEELGITNIMRAWTILIVLGVVLSIIVNSAQ